MMLKKVLVLGTVVSFLASATSAYAFTANGKISWYDGVGKTVNGHVLGEYDCATKIGFDNPPDGTKILATNLDNQKSVYVYKWDTGTMGGPSSVVILDVMQTVFKQLSNDGGLGSGYIQNARYVR